jgi:hypothetical protein
MYSNGSHGRESKYSKKNQENETTNRGEPDRHCTVGYRQLYYHSLQLAFK